MRKINYLFLAVTLVIMAGLFYISGQHPNTVDPETYKPAVYSTIGALLPPVIAIALALITKEVYSSLFVGIAIGALLYSNGNLELGLNTMLYNENGGMITKLSDSGNVGIMVFLVILGIMVALMNKVGGSAASASGLLKISRPALVRSSLPLHWVYLFLSMTISTV